MRGAEVARWVTVQQWSRHTHIQSQSLAEVRVLTTARLSFVVASNTNVYIFPLSHTHKVLWGSWMSSWPPCCCNYSGCYSALLREERGASAAAPPDSERTTWATVVSLWYPIGGSTSSLHRIGTLSGQLELKWSLSPTLPSYSKLSWNRIICLHWFTARDHGYTGLWVSKSARWWVCVCAGRADLVISWVGCSAGASLVWVRWGLGGLCVCVEVAEGEERWGMAVWERQGCVGQAGTRQQMFASKGNLNFLVTVQQHTPQTV